MVVFSFQFSVLRLVSEGVMSGVRCDEGRRWMSAKEIEGGQRAE